MLQRVFLVVLTLGIFCKCLSKCENSTSTNNVEGIYEPGGITARLNTILQDTNLNNGSCLLDVIDTIDAALRAEVWAMKMLDASGKLQSGLLEGNLVNLGSFSECLSVHGTSSANREIFGKYCLAAVFITQIKRPKNYTYAVTEDLERMLSLNPGAPLGHAICLPNSCTAQDMNYFINSTLITDIAPIDVFFDDAFCTPNSHTADYSFTYVHWITLILFAYTFVSMLLSTLYELYLLKYNLEPYHDILISYSIYANSKHLYKVRKDPDQLSCINGIRTLSMMWIILGHKYLMSVPFPHVNYFYMVTTWVEQTSSALVIGAMFSVDTFFLISGILIVYVVLLAKSKNFHFSIVQFYLHRQFRLYPAFIMMLLFHLTFLKYSTSGPVWYVASNHFIKACENNWWYSALYIQNVLDIGDVCVSQSWYLAADTQLYILSPLIFLPLQRWPKQTVFMIVLLAGCSCAFGFSMAWIMEINGRVSEITKQFRILYTSVFYRANSWLVGNLFGYYLFLKRGKKVQIHKTLVWVFWLLSISVMLFMVLMEEYFYQYEYNKLIVSLYYAFSKLLWCISLCWVIFACVHGYGGFINTFLSMKLFMVLGRLTYSMYIVHLAYFIICIFGGEIHTQYNNSSMLYEYGSDFILIVIISYIWTLAFESPLISIGKILLPSEMSKKLSEIHEENETNTPL